MNNYPIPYPNRQRVKFKYRCVSGTDVSGEAIGLKGETKEQIKKRLIASYKNSITPLSEIDGKTIDLRPFLDRIIINAQADIKEAQAKLKKVEAEYHDRVIHFLTVQNKS